MTQWRALVAVVLFASSITSQAATGLEQTAKTFGTKLAVSRQDYRGRPALKIVDSTGSESASPLIMLPVTGFGNGTIEADVVGFPTAGAPADMRGFVGIAFRVQADPARHEVLFIRPTNARADDQLRRNHATQYMGMPDYPWFRLRKENPGVYESYADMVAGEWTRLRIEVEGAKARLFVNGATQPALIVNDLKLGSDTKGGVALWVGNWTEAYFTDVKVTPAD